MPTATSVFLMVQPRSRRLSLPKPVPGLMGCSLEMMKDTGQFGGISTLSLVSVSRSDE